MLCFHTNNLLIIKNTKYYIPNSLYNRLFLSFLNKNLNNIPIQCVNKYTIFVIKQIGYKYHLYNRGAVSVTYVPSCSILTTFISLFP